MARAPLRRGKLSSRIVRAVTEACRKNCKFLFPLHIFFFSYIVQALSLSLYKNLIYSRVSHSSLSHGNTRQVWREIDLNPSICAFRLLENAQVLTVVSAAPKERSRSKKKNKSCGFAGKVFQCCTWEGGSSSSWRLAFGFVHKHGARYSTWHVLLLLEEASLTPWSVFLHMWHVFAHFKRLKGTAYPR
jgi:hypothetical protein